MQDAFSISHVRASLHVLARPSGAFPFGIHTYLGSGVSVQKLTAVRLSGYEAPGLYTCTCVWIKLTSINRSRPVLI